MLSTRATSVFRTQASVGTFRRGVRYLSSEGKPSPPSSSSSSLSVKQFATFAVAGGAAYGLFFILKDQFQAASPVQADNGPVPAQAPITSRVYFDVVINEKPEGRVVIGLHGSVVPKTVANFEKLCEGSMDYAKGKMTYQGSWFHRIIPSFMIQGGDFTMHNGMGGMSIYGHKFPDENFQLKHTGPGICSMANSGKNTNGSQFFICTKQTPHLDGKHVVFGVVQDGWDVVKRIEACGTRSGKPTAKVVIAECGVLPPPSAPPVTGAP